MGYVCNNCNFRTDREIKECLYCGRKEIAKEKAAGELLDEIEQLYS